MGLEENEKSNFKLDMEICDMFKNKLQVIINRRNINFSFRLRKPRNFPRPVLVALNTWHIKREVLENKWCLKNTKIVIKENFSNEVWKQR